MLRKARVVGSIAMLGCLTIAGLAGCGEENPRARSRSEQVTAPAGAKGLQMYSSNALKSKRGRSVAKIEAFAGGLNVPERSAVPLLDSSGTLFATSRRIDASGNAGARARVGVPIASMSIVHVDRDGRKRSLATDAWSIAASVSNKIAYAQGSGPLRNNQSYLTSVVVQDGVGGKPEVWLAAPARYEVLAWAGSTLLVSRTPEGLESGGALLAVTGPEQFTVVSPAASLAAISPDGLGVAFFSRDQGTDALKLFYWDAITRGATEMLSLGATAEPYLWVSQGSWVGEELIFPAEVVAEQGKAYGQQPAISRVSKAPDGTWQSQLTRLSPAQTISITDVFFTSEGAFGALGTRASELRSDGFSENPSTSGASYGVVVATCSLAGHCEFDTVTVPSGRAIGRLRQSSRPVQSSELSRTGSPALNVEEL